MWEEDIPKQPLEFMREWSHYLLGRSFTILISDHKSLQFMNDPKLIGFDFEIKYRPEKSNAAADALSRKMMFGAWHSSV
jgi:hypothetical protein